MSFVGINSLKERHDVTNLNFTIPWLSLLCIDIDLSLQPTLLMYVMHTGQDLW